MSKPEARKGSPAPIGVAVIGCGHWGPNLIRNFQRAENAELLWICDRDQSRLQRVAAELHLRAERSTDHRQALLDPRVQAVVVATPVTTHYSLARDALESGRHVLVEKPLARSVEECRQLVALAEAGGRVLMVDHTFLFSAPVMALKQTLQRGELGSILYAHAVRVNLGVFQEDINVLWDLLPHDLSIVQYLLEATPVEVSVQGSAHIHPQFEDVAFLTVYYEKAPTSPGAPAVAAGGAASAWGTAAAGRRTAPRNGAAGPPGDSAANGRAAPGRRAPAVQGRSEPRGTRFVAHFHASWLDPCKIRRMTLVGDRKMAVYDDMDPNEPLRIYDKGISRQPYFSDFGEFKLHYRFGDIHSPRIEITEPLKLVCGHFLDCILGQEKPRSDGGSGTEIVRILEAADRSLKNQGRLEPVADS